MPPDPRAPEILQPPLGVTSGRSAQVPAYQSALLLLTLGLAGSLLHEFALLSPLRMAMFTLGCALVLCGIAYNAYVMGKKDEFVVGNNTKTGKKIDLN